MIPAPGASRALRIFQRCCRFSALVHVQQQLREGLGEDRLTSWPVPWPLGHRPEALRHGRWPCVPPPGSWPATSPPAPRPGPRSRRHAPERRETGATAPRGPCHELSESFLAPKGRIPGRRSLCMATCKPTRLISGVDTCCSRSQRSAATGRHSAGQCLAATGAIELGHQGDHLEDGPAGRQRLRPVGAVDQAPKLPPTKSVDVPSF